jgi:UDP-N-acetylmuramoylalanine--D-glutamate ligase
LGKPADWLCVTGTNGKTTTVQLTTHILQAAGLRAMSCGNIGVPILDAIRDESGFDVLVVELSSFQLHYLGEIRPFASAVLNVEFDHLDWHGSFEAYSASKAKVFENVESACIYNIADPKTLRMVETADVQEGARAIGFGLAFPGPSNIGYVEDVLVDNAFSPMRKAKEIEPLATIDQIARVGVVTKHLLQNVAAAAALTRAYGVSAHSVGEAISTFKMDAHRIELIFERDGISFIDDSKATKPHATAASLDSFASVIWIVGGLLKGVDITSLVATVSSRVKAAIVIGVERSPVVDAFNEVAPQIPLVEVGDGEDVMGRALQAALGFADSGDTVLLAPAAASMDQFKDYSDRGRKFSDAVRNHFGVNDEN